MARLPLEDDAQDPHNTLEDRWMPRLRSIQHVFPMPIPDIVSQLILSFRSK